MPRAATSVQTRTSTLPLRKARSACSRAPWPRSPWTAPAAKPRRGELLGDVGGRPLRTAEDHRQPAALGLQDAGDHLRLVHGVRAEDVLRGVRHGLALVVRRGGADVRGLAHVAAGERDDLAGHRRGEEHRLPLGRQHLDDLLDVGQEAQVEHLVGLVQDERPDVGEAAASSGPPGRAAGRGCRRRRRRPSSGPRPAARRHGRRRSTARGRCGPCPRSAGRWSPAGTAHGWGRRRAPAGRR